jgi:hypothetical protein
VKSRLKASVRRLLSLLQAGAPPVPAPTPPTFDDEAAAIVHQTFVSVWDREADRFWVRNNLLLLVNGALLSVAATTDAPRGLQLILCGFGFYFSVHWLLINGKGAYYVGRWRPAIETYERFLSARPTFSGLPLSSVRPDSEVFQSGTSLRQRWQLLRGTHAPVRETGALMQAIILGFVLAWVCLAAFFSLHDPSAHNAVNPRISIVIPPQRHGGHTEPSSPWAHPPQKQSNTRCRPQRATGLGCLPH